MVARKSEILTRKRELKFLIFQVLHSLSHVKNFLIPLIFFRFFDFFTFPLFGDFPFNISTFSLFVLISMQDEKSKTQMNVSGFHIKNVGIESSVHDAVIMYTHNQKTGKPNYLNVFERK